MSLSSIVALFVTGPLSWLTVLAVIAFLALFAWLMHRLAIALGESAQSGQAARLVGTLASVADGIVETLLAHPPAPADVLSAVRAAAIAQGVAYVQGAMPATVKALGVSDTVLAARLSNEVAGALATVAPDLCAAPVAATPAPAAAAS